MDALRFSSLPNIRMNADIDILGLRRTLSGLDFRPGGFNPVAAFLDGYEIDPGYGVSGRTTLPYGLGEIDPGYGVSGRTTLPYGLGEIDPGYGVSRRTTLPYGLGEIDPGYGGARPTLAPNRWSLDEVRGIASDGLVASREVGGLWSSLLGRAAPVEPREPEVFDRLAYRFSEGNAGPNWSVVPDRVTRTEGNSGTLFTRESENGEIPDPYSYGRIGDGNLHIRMGTEGRPEFARRQPDGTFVAEEVALPKTGRFENDFRSLGNGIYMNREYDGTVNFGVRSENGGINVLPRAAEKAPNSVAPAAPAPTPAPAQPVLPDASREEFPQGESTPMEILSTGA